MRTPDGERELVEGDVACFPRSAAGAHQVRNATEKPVRILMLATKTSPRSSSTRTSGKVITLDAQGEGLFQTLYGEPVEYWDGES